MSSGVLGIDYDAAMDSAPVATALLMATLFPFLIYVQSRVADVFSNTLGELSNEFRMSHSLAGVTFLAFGNGAPDVLSSIAAFTRDSPNSDLGIGGLMGGGLFVSTIVLGFVLIYAGRVQVHGPNLYRDVAFYAGGIAYVLVLTLVVKRVSVLTASVFLMLYAAYAVLVVAIETRRRSAANNDSSSSLEVPFALPEPLDRLNSDVPGTWIENDVSPLQHIRDLHFTPVDSYALGDENLPADLSAQEQEETKFGSSFWTELYWRRLRLQRRAEPTLADLKSDFSNASVVERLFLVFFEWPPLLLHKLTIPDTTHWFRPLALVQPIFVCALSLFVFRNVSGFYVNVSVIGCTIVWMSVLFFTTHDSKPPSYRVILTFVAFYSCVTWIYLVAGEMVAMLTALGDKFEHVNSALLGLSLLAWANSAGDFAANRAVANRGFAEMAVSGCVASPLFNLLVGLGLSLCALTLRRKGFSLQPSVELEASPEAVVAAAFLSLSLVEILYFAKFSSTDYQVVNTGDARDSVVHLSPTLGRALLATYGVFCVVVGVLAVVR